jgi:hypothetical protein
MPAMGVGVMSGSSCSNHFGALSRYTGNRSADLLNLASPFHSEAGANVLFGASRLGRGHRKNIPVLFDARAVNAARKGIRLQGAMLADGGSALIFARARRRPSQPLMALIAFLCAVACASAYFQVSGRLNRTPDQAAKHRLLQI